LEREKLAIWRAGRFAIWTTVGVALVAAALAIVPAGRAAPQRDAHKRVISLNPSLTAIMLAIGAGESLVGVDTYSARQQPAVENLPRVGGLFNPSLEAVVSLQPDLVVLVPSAEQRDFRERLESLRIDVAAFKNFSFEEVLENIERLGDLTGHRSEALARIEAVRETQIRVERAAATRAGGGTSRARVIMVLQRDPLFVVGGRNFIDTMMKSTGVFNVAAEFSEPYPRVAMEWLIAARPEIIVDLSPEAQQSMGFWKRWSNLPAVQQGRLVALDSATISLPGPNLDRSLEILADAFWHDGAAQESIDVAAPGGKGSVAP